MSFWYSIRISNEPLYILQFYYSIYFQKEGTVIINRQRRWIFSSLSSQQLEKMQLSCFCYHWYNEHYYADWTLSSYASQSDQLKTHNAHQTWISFAILICHSRFSVWKRCSSAMPKNTHIAKMNTQPCSHVDFWKCCIFEYVWEARFDSNWEWVWWPWIAMRVQQEGDCKMCCKGQKWGLSEARQMCPCQVTDVTWEQLAQCGSGKESRLLMATNRIYDAQKTKPFILRHPISLWDSKHKQVIIRLVQWVSDATWDENFAK